MTAKVREAATKAGIKQDEIDRVADLLNSARQPAFILGRGTRWHLVPADLARQAAVPLAPVPAWPLAMATLLALGLCLLLGLARQLGGGRGGLLGGRGTEPERGPQLREPLLRLDVARRLLDLERRVALGRAS